MDAMHRNEWYTLQDSGTLRNLHDAKHLTFNTVDLTNFG